MISLFHPATAALALFQSTQLSVFERFLTQAVTGIDSTSITAGMQKAAYVVLLIGFLWQVYQSALHGGDVRGLGTNLIKYVVTAIVVMNYHTVFTSINQGFVNAGNWINSASGATSLFENWASDLKTQFSQVGFQKLWGLVTADLPGLIDALLIIVAYILYPVVIVIFGFFYMLYGSILYIFGPIVIALMPLGATNRLAKSYAENVFIWNAWPILYGGFGALLSAVQMGQIGQMLNSNNFLGGLGNLEGSILIGLASIIYSLAIAVIPFIAKKIVSGDVGSTASTLLGAAATALTAGVAATEGVAAGLASTSGQAVSGGGRAAASSVPAGNSSAATGSNQPAVPQRMQPGTGEQQRSMTSTSAATPATSPSLPSSFPSTQGEVVAEGIRGGLESAIDQTSKNEAGVPSHSAASSSNRGNGTTTAKPTDDGTASPSRGTTSPKPSHHKGNGPSAGLMRPHGLATWGAYHAARLATQGAVGGARAVGATAKGVTNTIANPVKTAGQVGTKAGQISGNVVNAAEKTAAVSEQIANGVTHPRKTVGAGAQAMADAARTAVSNASSTVRGSASAMKTNFSQAYEKTRVGEMSDDKESA
ncbi:MAG: hypothetical protein KGK08_01660 [Acidobacteriota bacterium]|nr:hypothetical protein [Acidobacteriota bacterium]